MAEGKNAALSISGLNAWYGDSHILQGIDLVHDLATFVDDLGEFDLLIAVERFV